MRFELGARDKREVKDVQEIFLCLIRRAHILEVVLVSDQHGLFDFAVMHFILLGRAVRQLDGFIVKNALFRERGRVRDREDEEEKVRGWGEMMRWWGGRVGDVGIGGRRVGEGAEGREREVGWVGGMIGSKEE